MIGRLALNAAFLLGLSLLPFMIVAASADSPKAAAVVVPGLVIGGYLVLHPFVGLTLLLVLAQLDAVSNMVSAGLPVSAYKLLTVATLAGYGLTSFRMNPQDRLGPNAIELRYAVLFALSVGISFLLSRYKSAGLDYLFGLLGVMVILYLIVVLTDTVARLEALVIALVVAGFVTAITVLAETALGVRFVSTSDAAATAAFQGQARSAGMSDYNPTTAAHMLLATTILAGMLAIGHHRYRAFAGLTFLVGVPALVTTLARSAIIALVLVALLFAWNHRRHRLAPFVLLCSFVAAILALPLLPDAFWERMASVLNIEMDRTLLRRVSYNLIGLDLFFQNPFFGIGPGNFPEYYAGNEYRWFPGREPVPRQLHNSYLEVATETGLIGLILFLGVMLSALRRGFQAAASADKRVSGLAAACSYAFAAFLVASFFMPNQDTKFMWILPGLCIAAWRVMPPPPETAKDMT